MSCVASESVKEKYRLAKGMENVINSIIMMFLLHLFAEKKREISAVGAYGVRKVNEQRFRVNCLIK